MSANQNNVAPFPSPERLLDLAIIAEDTEVLMDPDIRRQGLEELVIPTGDRLAGLDPHNENQTRQFLGDLDDVYRLEGIPEAFAKLMLLGIHPDKVPEDEEVYRGFFETEPEVDLELHRNNAAICSVMQCMGNLMYATIKYRPGTLTVSNPASQVTRLISQAGITGSGVNAMNIAAGNFELTAELSKRRTAKQIKKIVRGAGSIVKAIEIANSGQREGLNRLGRALTSVLAGTANIAEGNDPDIIRIYDENIELGDETVENHRIGGSAKPQLPRPVVPTVIIEHAKRDKSQIAESIDTAPFDEATNQDLKQSPLARELKSGGNIQLGKHSRYTFNGFGDLARLGLGFLNQLEDMNDKGGEEKVNSFIDECFDWLRNARQTMMEYRTCGGDELHQLASRITVIEQLFNYETVQVLSNPIGKIKPETRLVLRALSARTAVS